MYVKVKQIKYTILIIICFSLAGFNYFTYAETTDNKNKSSACDKKVDSDCDGLTNAEEKLYGTNLDEPDTDGDSYSDGVEIESGYDPLKAAPGDKIIEKTTSPEKITSLSSNQSAMTQDVIQKIQTLVDSDFGGDKKITSSELQSLISSTLSEKFNSPITWDALPQIDAAKLKILKQPYSSLSEEERKNKLGQDAFKYIVKMGYLLNSNAPSVLTTDDDAKKFLEDFSNRLSSFSTLSPDYEYFIDLENRLGMFSEQAMEIEVPETMTDLHIKFIRLTKGFSQLSDSTQKNQQDPVANSVALSNIMNFINLLEEFSNNDLQNYLAKIK